MSPRGSPRTALEPHRFSRDPTGSRGFPALTRYSILYGGVVVVSRAKRPPRDVVARSVRAVRPLGARSSHRDSAPRKDCDFRRPLAPPRAPPRSTFSLSLLLALSLSFSLLSFFPHVSSRRGPPPILRTGAGGRPRCSKFTVRREAF